MMSSGKSFSTAALALLTPGIRALSSTPTASAKVAGARYLGGTDLVVSEACLGTMTIGIQNDAADAFQQIDYARSCGINFIDTAEVYPVPFFAKGWRAGVTETIVGEYLQSIGPAARDDLVVATKVAGYFPNSKVATERHDPPKADPIDCRLDAASVKMACDASLRRLQTDRIDLYQIHWPDRYVPVFGQTEFQHDAKRENSVPILETAAALRDLIEEGKVRCIGLSNETPYGVSQWVQACETLGIRDKLASIQNSYSLLDRRFDSDLSEMCDAHNIGLLPWSILAGGLLSGKYRRGQQTPPSSKSRFVLFPDYMKRWNPASASDATLSAVDEYSRIAERAGMTPSELAVAFVRSRRFVSEAGSTIVGATTLEQLKENLEIFQKPAALDDDVLEAINQVHLKSRDPSCSL